MSKTVKTFYLDPDFRIDPPVGKPYCIRCQKEIKDPSSAVRVTADWEAVTVVEGGPSLIGPDCWKVISKTPGTNTGEGKTDG